MPAARPDSWSRVWSNCKFTASFIENSWLVLFRYRDISWSIPRTLLCHDHPMLTSGFLIWEKQTYCSYCARIWSRTWRLWLEPISSSPKSRRNIWNNSGLWGLKLLLELGGIWLLPKLKLNLHVVGFEPAETKNRGADSEDLLQVRKGFLPYYHRAMLTLLLKVFTNGVI